MGPINEKNAAEAARTVKDSPVISAGTVRRSLSITQLAAAMVAVQKQIEDPTKNKKADAGGRGSYRYADLPTVLDVVRPALTANGFAVMQFPCELDGQPALTTMLIHSSGEWVETTACLRAVKPDPQGIGSALTYARRYALLALCGIAADDDDDGKAASHQQQPTRQANGKADTRSLFDLCSQAIHGAVSRDHLTEVYRQFEADVKAGKFTADDKATLDTAFKGAAIKFPKPPAPAKA